MEKSYLQEYNTLKVLSNMCEEEILAIEEKYKEHDQVRGSYKEHPWTLHNISIEGISEQNPEMKSKLARLKRQKKKADEHITRIEEFIMLIEDPIIQKIFEMKYLEGMSWEKISNRFGKQHESYARKKHDRYLNL